MNNLVVEPRGIQLNWPQITQITQINQRNLRLKKRKTKQSLAELTQFRLKLFVPFNVNKILVYGK